MTHLAPVQSVLEGFIYEQATGRLTVHGPSGSPRLIGVGYAGATGYVNAPGADRLKSKGPLPRGEYSMRLVSHPRFASPCIKLSQTEGESYGRGGFYIHGDNARGDRSASTGCIVLGPLQRKRVLAEINAGVRPRLTVVR